MAPKDTDERKGDDKDDDQGLDMSQTAVKKMIAEARERGYITYDQLNTVLPPEQVSSEQIEDVMSMLSEMGINIIEDDEAEEEEAKGGDLATTTARDVVVSTSETEKLDRTDDPVRMYLREMGSVELLSREGEIAIAKRIEAGRKTMILGLCESPLTFQAITIWREELLNEDILLRDVIDLESTFSGSVEEEGENATARSCRHLVRPSPQDRPRKKSRNWTQTATRSPPTMMMTKKRNRPTCHWRRWKRVLKPRVLDTLDCDRKGLYQTVRDAGQPDVCDAERRRQLFEKRRRPSTRSCAPRLLNW